MEEHPNTALRKKSSLESAEEADLIEIYRRPYKPIRLSILAIALAVLFVVHLLATQATSYDLNPILFTILYVLMCGIIFVGVIEFFWRRELPLFLLGYPKIRLRPDPIRAGSTLECVIYFKPRIPIHLKDFSVCLETKETIITGIGDHRHTKVYYKLVKGYKKKLKAKFHSGEAVELKIPIHIHKYKRPSTEWGQNKFEWFVIVAMNIRGWPNWGRKEIFELRKP